MKYFRKYFRMLAVIGLVFMSAMLGLIPAPGNAHTGVAFASFPSDTWTIVDTPNIANADNYLQEVTVISNNNVWAVGYSVSSGVKSVLIMRYDGSVWTTYPATLASGTYSSSLYGVAATSINNMWAVGSYSTSSGPDRTLTMHWDGVSWNYVPSPNIGNYNNDLNSVAVVGTSLWAVGSYADANGIVRTLIVDGNGATSGPDPSSTLNSLTGVTAITSSDVWASGIYNDSSGIHKELLLKWNGTSWTRYDGPSPGRAPNLYKIGAIASNDVWTAGFFIDTGLHYGTLTEHWNGSVWNYIPSANRTGTSVLWAVAPVEHSAVWTAGYGYPAPNGTTGTLTEYWDGTSWSIVSSPNRGTGINKLYGASSTPGGSVVGGYDAWSVGYSTDTSSGLKQTLSMVYSHPANARHP